METRQGCGKRFANLQKFIVYTDRTCLGKIRAKHGRLRVTLMTLLTWTEYTFGVFFFLFSRNIYKLGETVYTKIDKRREIKWFARLF